MSSTYSLRLPGFKPRPGGCDKESRGSGGKPVTGLLEMIFSNFSHVSNLMQLDHLGKAHVEHRGTVTTVYAEGWKFLLRNDAKNPGNTLRPTSVRG